MITVTGQEIYEAIEENGHEWLYEDFIKVLGPDKFAACAIGQAELNLGIDIEAITDEIGHPFKNIMDDITTFNDKHRAHTHDDDNNCVIVHPSIPEIKAYAKETLSEVWEQEFTFEELDINTRKWR